MRADRRCLLSINQRPQLTIVVFFSFESKQDLQHTGLEKNAGSIRPPDARLEPKSRVVESRQTMPWRRGLLHC